MMVLFHNIIGNSSSSSGVVGDGNPVVFVTEQKSLNFLSKHPDHDFDQRINWLVVEGNERGV